MTDWVVDTNVAVVANGRDTNASLTCRLATLEFLRALLVGTDRILIDLAGAALSEYRRHCAPSGQPGLGDRFFNEVLRSHPDRIVRLHPAQEPDGSYSRFPAREDLARFDLSDRKWVCIALEGDGTIATAVDSDWAEHKVALRGRIGNPLYMR